MGPRAILAGAGAVGIFFIGVYIFPTMQTAVTSFTTNVMPGLALTDFEELMISLLGYAGAALYLLFAFWFITGGDN